MTSLIFTISAILSYVFSVVLLIYSLVFCFRSYQPGYMKSLPIYCFGNVLANFLNAFYTEFQGVIYLLFTVFELLYFSYFLTRLITTSGVNKLVWILTGLLMAYIIFHIIKKDAESFVDPFEVLECIILIIPCLVYFWEIFSKPKVMDLRREPSFWMVAGILFYFVLLIPTVFFSSYFLYLKKEAIAKAFYSINNYAQVISFLLFIKAMRWRRKVSFR